MSSFSRVPSRTLASVALALVALPSFAVVSTTTGSTELDTDFTFVGTFSDRDTGTSLYGSGVVVGPNQILTARHVSGVGSFGVERFTLNGVAYTPTSVINPPDYTLPDGTKTKVDISLVTVAETFNVGYFSIGSSTSVGSTITMVGFGQGGGVSGNGYMLDAAGSRHKGDNTLDLVNYPVGGSIGPTLISYLDRAGEASLADKDSGGGWFQNGRLIGISSFIFNDTQPSDADPAKYRNFGFAAANTSGYDSLIDSPNYTGDPYTIGAGEAYFGSGAIDLTNPQVNSWLRANVVPEPTSMLALGLGAVAFLRRRKKA